jgi:hypothetical protein
MSVRAGRRRLSGLLAGTLLAGLTAAVGPAPVGAATLSFSPTADAQVSAASPSTNYGRAKTLGVGTSPQVASYLRFDVRNVTERVRQARLRVFVATGGGTVDGPAVYPVGNTWTEQKVAWASRPARTGSVPLSDTGALAAGSWVDFDVTAAVTGNGTFSFGLVGTSADATTFVSREEKKNKPVLVVETAPVPPPPPPPPVEPGPIRDVLLAPATGAWWGVHHKISASLSDDGKKQAITDFEALVGRTMAIDHYYEPWGNIFPTFRESWDLAHGRIPMISWGKTTTTAITSGQHDAYIRARANAIEALGQPVFIRWFWEMDGTRNADVAVSPSAYVAAWKYLRSIFAAEGATNVAWVWCPNASAFEDGSAQSFYPGDDHVEWVCADGYNWYPSDNRAYQGFEEKFQAFHDFAVAHGKPAMAGEYGTQKMPEPGRRAQWLRDAADAVQDRMTNMLAVVYFHSYSPDYNWQFYDEPDALTAFADMGALPYFNP